MARWKDKQATLNKLRFQTHVVLIFAKTEMLIFEIILHGFLITVFNVASFVCWNIKHQKSLRMRERIKNRHKNFILNLNIFHSLRSIIQLYAGQLEIM